MCVCVRVCVWWWWWWWCVCVCVCVCGRVIVKPPPREARLARSPFCSVARHLPCPRRGTPWPCRRTHLPQIRSVFFISCHVLGRGDDFYYIVLRRGDSFYSMSGHGRRIFFMSLDVPTTFIPCLDMGRELFSCHFTGRRLCSMYSDGAMTFIPCLATGR